MRHLLGALPALALGFAMATSIATFSCRAPSLAASSRSEKPSVLFQETFEDPDTVRRHWLVIAPESSGATMLTEDGAARLVLPSRGELSLLRMLDASAVRGRRLRVFARIRTDSTNADAQVMVAFGDSAPSFRTRVRTEPVSADSWRSISTMVDVDPGALRVELSLVARGTGNAWFDDIRVELLEQAITRSNVVLTSQQMMSVQALTRAIALIRYRHPSDQAAKLDWNSFFPIAIDRVLQAADEGTLLSELRDLFGKIAPTVEFSRLPTYSVAEPPHGGAAHLSRWRHAGLGPGMPYSSWREGRDPDQANVLVDTPVAISRLSDCKNAQLRATVRGIRGDGRVFVYADVYRQGRNIAHFDREVARDNSMISFDFDMPIDAHRVRLGIEIKAQSETTLEALSLTCDNRDSVHVDLGKATWLHRDFYDLYSYALHPCGVNQCLEIARRPFDATFVPSRDVLDAKITENLWMHMPLAVWVDDRRTLPEMGLWVSPAPGTATDTAERLATVASAWATLSVFYPYFRDQDIDWLRELPGALTGAAASRSTADTYLALAKLIAKLRDNHARAIHPAFPIDGILPVTLRKFADKLVVVGALPEYAKLLPVGTEILSIDRVPAMQLYADMSDRVSSATPGWVAWAVPTWLTLGPLGTFSTVRIMTADSREVDVLLPHLSREFYDSLIKEPRPPFGATLAPGVHYVDLELMKAERWQAALPALANARVIILDMRGYPSNAVFTLLGHFIDREIRSPEWQVPTVEADGYRTSYWTIQPMKPRLSAKLIVLLDGRASSAAETFLQIVRDNHLATLVGETSSGTNGNPKIVALPGGFSMRFTGMRVPFADGTALQGRGIVPDEVVHPTLQAVREGRDEILHAAMARAGKLIATERP
jgi:hypothetical protein